MPRCGSQVILCDLPIRFDTYTGCSHRCKYCFVTRKSDIRNISAGESPAALRRFISGARTSETEWCDWNIPLHWGGMSDPFQPIEAERRISLECLKVFAETKYPFIVSTKGTPVLASEEYLELLAQCNAVVQVSLISPAFDRLEPGAPPFERRLSDIVKISKAARRVIIRIQPYVRDVKSDILRNLCRYAAAGVYGITIEGIKYFQRRPGFVKVAADYCYPKDVLRRDYEQIRSECAKAGLHFFCAENRLRDMGENLCCCGIAGLDDFKPFTANLVHLLHEGRIHYTANMRTQPGKCFKAIAQDTVSTSAFRRLTFAEIMDLLSKDRKTMEALQ